MNGYGVISLSKNDLGSITVAFKYEPLLVEKVKTIEGRKWHPAEKYWSVPYSELRGLSRRSKRSLTEKILS